MIRVCLVDDQTLVRQGIRSLLALDDGIALTGAHDIALTASASDDAVVEAAEEGLPLTLDAVDYRGLEYQTGVSFSVFALKGRQELARGGRYSAGYPEDGVSEPATGFTLYMDAVLASSETPSERPRLFLPAGTPWRDAAPWQAKGYAVVRAVTPAEDSRREAKRLRCTHALVDGEAVPL